MNTKAILIITVLFTSFLHTQNLSQLENKNGFRGIKLGSNINNYPQFIKKDSTNIKYFGIWKEYDYVFNHSYRGYDKISEAEINRILIKTFNDVIYEIFISVEHKYEVLDLMKTLYGEPTWTNGDSPHIWQWSWCINNITCNIYDDNEISYHMKYSARPYRLYYINDYLAKKYREKDIESKKNKAKSEF